MKHLYKFITGNSRVTPIGIVVAVAAAVLLNSRLGSALPAVYLGILLVTLAVSTLEQVQ